MRCWGSSCHHPDAWPCPPPLQVPPPNPLDKRHPFQVSDQEPQRKQPFVLPRELFGAKGGVKTLVGGHEGPTLPGPRSAPVQEGGHRPPTDLPSDSEYNLCHIFSEFRRNFSELEKRPTASSQSLGSLGSHFLSTKIPEEQSWMPQVPTPILKSDKTAG